jgi:hypothetical protein
MGIDGSVADDGYNSSGVFQMIELMWLKQVWDKNGKDGGPIEKMILRFRQEVSMGGVTLWTEWKDVPVVEEENE